MSSGRPNGNCNKHERIVRAFEEDDDVSKLEIDGVVVERSHYEQQKALLKQAGEIEDE